MNTNNPPLKVEVDPEVADGVYSNMAVITHSSAEFIVDFVRVLPNVGTAKVKSRIVLAPEHAKRLLLALQNNMENYEKKYGRIELPGAGQTANPFNIKKGEA